MSELSFSFFFLFLRYYIEFLFLHFQQNTMEELVKHWAFVRSFVRSFVRFLFFFPQSFIWDKLQMFSRPCICGASQNKGASLHFSTYVPEGFCVGNISFEVCLFSKVGGGRAGGTILCGAKSSTRTIIARGGGSVTCCVLYRL